MKKKLVLLTVLIALVLVLAWAAPVGAGPGCGDTPKPEGPCIICRCYNVGPFGGNCVWTYNDYCMNPPGPHH
jgi:hypothetical protein